MSRGASVSFEKWEGLGNDFAVVEAGALDPTPDLVRRLCDRRFGIGADGILLVDREHPRMTVYNADGSRPEMCGNGLRCVAAYLTASGAPDQTPEETHEIAVATDAGHRDCLIYMDREGRFEVSVEMGVARRTPDLVVHLDGREHRFAAIDMGNPHAITFERYDEAAIDSIGPRVATAPAGGVNVEFCRLGLGEARDPTSRIEVTVWERGVGRTLACGTGACAVAAAACDEGIAAFDEPLRIALPGGELTITVAKGSRAVRMRGPARRVFRGTVEIA